MCRSRVLHSHTGAAFEAGRLGHRNGPQIAGNFFRKIDCFCFEQQTLKAGEKRIMPVVFVIDPKLPDDVHTITLSYTFFEVAGTRAHKAGDDGRG